MANIEECTIEETSKNVLLPPTIDLTESCKELWRAIEGLGTDKETIIRILSSCSNIERQKIREKYQFMYQADLLDEIKAEQTVTAQLKDGLFGLIYHPAEYDAKELFNALDSLDILSSHKLSFFDFVKARRNARLATIIDIMITRSNDELKEIESYYKKLFKKDLDNDLKSNFFLGASFVRLLRSLALTKRSTQIDMDRAVEDATHLFNSEGIIFENETELIRVFTRCSLPQLADIVNQYQILTGKFLSTVIKENVELEDEFKECLISIMDFANDSASYKCNRIRTSLGTNEKSYLRIIMTDAEKDMEVIKRKYFELFSVTLLDDIVKKTSGSYQQLLKAVVGK